MTTRLQLLKNISYLNKSIFLYEVLQRDKYLQIFNKMQKQHSWFPLFSTNFMSVLNDNYMKWLIIFIFIMTRPEEEQGLMISVANGLFVIPYILFSSIAGNITRKNNKVTIIRYAKAIEIPIMIVTSVGFFLSSLPIVLTALFLMGLQSSLFSPAKYGLIRDVGGKKRVSFGTGAMEMLTFLGVLLGTYFGGEFSDSEKYDFINEHRDIFVSATLIGFAVIGWLLSLGLKADEPEVEHNDGTAFFVTFIIQSLKWAKEHLPKLNYVVLGLSCFWLIASLLQMNLLLYCKHNFAMSSSEIGFTQAMIAIAIAIGSILAGVISKDKVNLKLVSIGAICMIVSLCLIFILPSTKTTFILLISCTALFAGIYKIPLNAWLQANIEGRKLGEMIAFNNLMVFIFILLSAGLFALLTAFFSSATIFLFIAGITLCILLFLLRKLPEMKLSKNKE